MLHNKYYELLKPFLGDCTREVYGRELIPTVRQSPKGIALALAELERLGILKSRRQGTLKYYRLNADHTEIRDILAIAELLRKIDFLGRHRALAHLAGPDDRIVGVFGSFAAGTQKPDSDVDLFIVGPKKPDKYRAKGERLGLELSPRYFTKQQWTALLRQKNNLCKEIVKNHIILSQAEAFIATLWSEYYGLR